MHITAIKKILALATAAAFLAAGAMVAEASQITYNWVSGQATLTATNNNTGTNYLASGAFVPLTAPSSVTFDAAALTVPSWKFTDQGTTNLALQGPLSGDTLELTNLTAVPDAIYSSGATGTNPYNITIGKLDVSGSYEVVKGATIVAGPKAFAQVDPSLSGQVTLSGTKMTSLTLNGITFGQITVGGTPITIKGDVEFTGTTPVPVPAAIWLLGSGLMGLSGSVFTRHRRAV